jgi:hypothetical protein
MTYKFHEDVLSQPEHVRRVMWINTTLLRLVPEQPMAFMFDIAENNIADSYKYRL